MAAEDEAALVAAARAGSPAALARLIDAHQQAVRAFLRRVAPTWDAADDLAQETFLAACSKLSSWRGESSVRTWLCGIAWRKAKGAQRSFFRGLARDGAYAERAGLEQPRRVEAEDRLALAAALNELPLEQRAAVSLCLSEDFSHAEAALILDLPLGTVKSHVARGRARLLLLLEERS